MFAPQRSQKSGWFCEFAFFYVQLALIWQRQEAGLDPVSPCSVDVRHRMWMRWLAQEGSWAWRSPVVRRLVARRNRKLATKQHTWQLRVEAYSTEEATTRIADLMTDLGDIPKAGVNPLPSPRGFGCLASLVEPSTIANSGLSSWSLVLRQPTRVSRRRRKAPTCFSLLVVFSFV